MTPSYGANAATPEFSCSGSRSTRAQVRPKPVRLPLSTTPVRPVHEAKRSHLLDVTSGLPRMAAWPAPGLSVCGPPGFPATQRGPGGRGALPRCPMPSARLGCRSGPRAPCRADGYPAVALLAVALLAGLAMPCHAVPCRAVALLAALGMTAAHESPTGLAHGTSIAKALPWPGLQGRHRADACRLAVPHCYAPREICTPRCICSPKLAPAPACIQKVACRSGCEMLRVPVNSEHNWCHRTCPRGLQGLAAAPRQRLRQAPVWAASPAAGSATWGRPTQQSPQSSEPGLPAVDLAATAVAMTLACLTTRTGMVATVKSPLASSPRAGGKLLALDLLMHNQQPRSAP